MPNIVLMLCRTVVPMPWRMAGKYICSIKPIFGASTQVTSFGLIGILSPSLSRRAACGLANPRRCNLVPSERNPLFRRRARQQQCAIPVTDHQHQRNRQQPPTVQIILLDYQDKNEVYE